MLHLKYLAESQVIEKGSNPRHGVVVVSYNITRDAIFSYQEQSSNSSSSVLSLGPQSAPTAYLYFPIVTWVRLLPAILGISTV